MSEIMEESNKLVIRVKYPSLNTEPNIETSQGVVTEWHRGRVLGAAVTLIVLIILAFYLFTDNALESADAFESGLVNKVIEKSEDTKKIEMVVGGIKKQQQVKQSKPYVLPNINIARALLTTRVDNKEPVDNIISPVVVNKNTASSIYYFTEIINMKGQGLYHHWLREGKLIYKRKFNIIGDRWRVATSKLISYSKIGAWVVRLVDAEGVILNEIKFEAIE